MADTNVLFVQNHKGGIGKTTISFNFAFHQARKGKRILYIITDPQNELASWLLRKSDFDYIYKNPTETPDNTIEKTNTLYNTLIKRQDLPVYQSVYENIDVVPSTIHLVGADIELAAAQDHTEQRLKKQLDKIKNNYDLVIIDGQPNLGLIVLNAFVAANHLIIIVEPGEFSLGAIEKIDQTLNELIYTEYEHDINVLGIVVNKFLDRDIPSRETVAELLEAYSKDNLVFKTHIPSRNMVQKAEKKNVPVVLLDPKNDFATAMDDFCDEFDNKIKLLK